MANKTIYTVGQKYNCDVIQTEVLDEDGDIIDKNMTFITVDSRGVLVQTYFWDREKDTYLTEVWYPVTDSDVVWQLVNALRLQDIVGIYNWISTYDDIGIVRYNDICFTDML